ncbi:MAG TPA: hypothetical protein VGJ21_20165 [Terracidiphilus sp.]|jgi:hypothetical protein
MIRSSSAVRSRAYRALKHLGILTVFVLGALVHDLPAQKQLTAPSGTPLYPRAAFGPGEAATFVSLVRTPESGLAGSGAFRSAPSGFEKRAPYLVEASLVHRNIQLAASPLNVGPGDVFGASIGLFHIGPQLRGGVDAFRSAPIRAAWRSEESLCSLPSIFARSLADASGGSYKALFSLATLHHMMGGDLYLPFGSSVGGLRFDYDDNVKPGVKTASHSSGSATAMFTSSILRNGMTLSAGALFGGRPTLFPPAGEFRLPAAAQKSASPSLALKVSF